jgi:hypothetical protein
LSTYYENIISAAGFNTTLVFLPLTNSTDYSLGSMGGEDIDCISESWGGGDTEYVLGSWD